MTVQYLALEVKQEDMVDLTKMLDRAEIPYKQVTLDEIDGDKFDDVTVLT